MHSFDTLVETFRQHGCERLFIKRLSKNDNSKQQVYLGQSFDVLNTFPHGEIIQKEGTFRPTWWTEISFKWMNESGAYSEAPHTKVILYPKYPEIRLSGFLRGCSDGPNSIMTSRAAGRILFLGIRHDRDVIAYVCDANHPVSISMESKLGFEGVFDEFPLLQSNAGMEPLEQLISDIRDIHNSGWIDGQRLDRLGNIVPCNAQNAIGMTLESQLGIKTNGLPGPDKFGWEIKAHTVSKWDKIPSKPVSLITTEPDGGIYVNDGLPTFIEHYGYEDGNGDKRFGGIHRVGELGRSRKNRENLTLTLTGYDETTQKITDTSGTLSLEDGAGDIAASWSFTHLLERWTKKHNKTMFVPALAKKDADGRKYYYGDRVRLGYNSDFRRLLNALNEGNVYLDPMPVIYASGGSRKRSMFRINLKQVPVLYERFEERLLTSSTLL